MRYPCAGQPCHYAHMQPDRHEQTASPSEVTHLLDYTNLATLGPDALTARLRLLGEHRNVVSDLGGRIATVLLTRDGYTQSTLATKTGIAQQTLSRWTAPYRAGAA
jgi:hypothetical protein